MKSQKITNFNRYEKLTKQFEIIENFNETFDYISIFVRIAKKSRKTNENIKNLCSTSFKNLIEILDKLDTFGRGVTLEKMKFTYGENQGQILFDEYRNKQAITNSFEYKKEKYGWNKENFDDFNKSRAVTLKNLSRKHGDENGKIMFKTYCDKQAYTNTEAHLGSEAYSRVNKQKAHTFESYLNRYGCEKLALEKLDEYHANSNGFYSKISQQLFWSINETKTFQTMYFAELNREYGVYSKTQNKYFKYDFVSLDKNICIE